MNTAITTGAVSARIAERVAQAVGPRKYTMWFDRSARFDYDETDRRLRVCVPNRFVADWIGRHFENDLRHAATDTVGTDVQIDLTVEPEAFSETESGTTPATPIAEMAARPAAPERPAPARSSGGLLQSTAMGGASGPAIRHRLEDFIVGPSNELAHAAAMRLVEELDRDLAPESALCSHPLFLHGSCGLGKTHLLQGICRRLLEQKPHAKVVYTTGEQFTNQYITAIRQNKLDSFRQRIRGLDLLAVDDLHFLADKDKTQQEFLHSFDQIDLGGARLVLASDCHPKLIRKFSEALVSRCVQGLVVEIHEPDTETRRRLIEQLAQRRSMVLLPSVATDLAERATGSVREIEGLLTKLHALASLTGSQPSGGILTIGHATVQRLLSGEMLAGTPALPTRPMRYSQIATAVGNRLRVTPRQLAGPGRHKQVVLARCLIVHLVRQMTSMSYPEIAMAMGKANHSTVITAAKRFEKQLAANEPLLLAGDTGPIYPADLVTEARRMAIEQPV